MPVIDYRSCSEATAMPAMDPSSASNAFSQSMPIPEALDHPTAHGVVADGKCDRRERDSQRGELRRHVRPPLTHVNGYRQSVHENTLSKRRCDFCVPTQCQICV